MRSSTRQQLVLEFAKLVEQNTQLLAALATLETGVPLARTRSEVDLDDETEVPCERSLKLYCKYYDNGTGRPHG